MTYNAAKPAACGARAGSGMFLRDGWNNPDDSFSPLDLQAKTLARRFGLTSARSRLVAALAFDGRRG